RPVAAIPDDLAADGVDELLVVFVQYATTEWPEDFAGLLEAAGNRTVRLVAPQRSWLLHMTSRDVRVDESDADSPSATVEGSAPDLLVWLWSRGGAGVMATGDAETIALLRKVLVESTQ